LNEKRKTQRTLWFLLDSIKFKNKRREDTQTEIGYPDIEMIFLYHCAEKKIEGENNHQSSKGKCA